jgi:membrane protein DedA with SNARE-associated domain
MFHLSIESIIALLGYFGIFLLMIPNGIVGFPSSQILYIVCGYFIFTGSLLWVPVIFAGALGNTLGNIFLYEVIRKKGLEYIFKYKIFPKEKIMKVEKAFQRKGAWFLFFGKLLPAIKVFAPIPPAIGKMDRRVYVSVIFISSLLWTLPFLAIGYFFGKSSDVFGKYALFLIPFALIVAYLFYRYIEKQTVEEIVLPELSEVEKK